MKNFLPSSSQPPQRVMTLCRGLSCPAFLFSFQHIYSNDVYRFQLFFFLNLIPKKFVRYRYIVMQFIVINNIIIILRFYLDQPRLFWDPEWSGCPCVLFCPVRLRGCLWGWCQWRPARCCLLGSCCCSPHYCPSFRRGQCCLLAICWWLPRDGQLSHAGCGLSAPGKLSHAAICSDRGQLSLLAIDLTGRARSSREEICSTPGQWSPLDFDSCRRRWLSRAGSCPCPG